MPFLFAYTPLLLTGSWLAVSVTVAACLLGIVAWAGMLEGFVIHETIRLERLLLAAASVCLLLPVGNLIVYVTPLRGEAPIPRLPDGSFAPGNGILHATE